MKDYNGQQEILVVIVIMDNDLKLPRSIMAVSAEDFEKLRDKEIRRLFRLEKYQKKSYSALDVINGAFHSREIEYFKKFEDEEFQSEYVKYLLSTMHENLN